MQTDVVGLSGLAGSRASVSRPVKIVSVIFTFNLTASTETQKAKISDLPLTKLLDWLVHCFVPPPSTLSSFSCVCLLKHRAVSVLLSWQTVFGSSGAYHPNSNLENQKLVIFFPFDARPNRHGWPYLRYLFHPPSPSMFPLHHVTLTCHHPGSKLWGRVHSFLLVAGTLKPNSRLNG